MTDIDRFAVILW